ncbi:MAG TPA: hypothetical protein P5160_02555, partial [Candidatus Omnitrophota bacterium]|nr:hypothetical protein [Candidatus Omnitrophota bacterium]
MDATVLAQLKDLGISAAVALAAVGSGLGAGYAGMAAVGANILYMDGHVEFHLRIGRHFLEV